MADTTHTAERNNTQQMCVDGPLDGAHVRTRNAHRHAENNPTATRLSVCFDVCLYTICDVRSRRDRADGSQCLDNRRPQMQRDVFVVFITAHIPMVRDSTRATGSPARGPRQGHTAQQTRGVSINLRDSAHTILGGLDVGSSLSGQSA